MKLFMFLNHNSSYERDSEKKKVFNFSYVTGYIMLLSYLCLNRGAAKKTKTVGVIQCRTLVTVSFYNLDSLHFAVT